MVQRLLAAIAFAFSLSFPLTILASHSVVIQGKNKLAIVDASGSITWEMPWGGIHDIHVLKNGNIMVQQHMKQIVEIDRQTKKIVWSYDSSTRNGNAGRRIEVHAFQPLENGDAYKRDVTHFANVLGIETREQLYSANHKAVTYWEKYMRDVDELEPSTIRRKLSALSSLVMHLVDHDVAAINPVREIKRPELDRSEGKTLAFSKKEARKILDSPDKDTLLGKRDRAILSVGFQAGFRREEIANLKVDALHKNKGIDAQWVKRKRKRNRQSVTISPLTAQRIQEYLDAVGHADDRRGPMFRPVRNKGLPDGNNLRRHMDPKNVDRILKKYAEAALGVVDGYSAHSMRATFATTALERCGH